ncbi:dynein axonemal heavy chain 9-like, partial [Patagioenas fasciata]|uniref:dynein axonemal heavy chain 9-like n=1 Tax=Patagioenas fasciata TaxID=372321 RepID=UPI003A99A518
RLHGEHKHPPPPARTPKRGLSRPRLAPRPLRPTRGKGRRGSATARAAHARSPRQPAPCPPPGAQRSVARSQARRAGGRGEASAGASCRSAEEPRARVIVPILTNKKNHQGWPQVVSQDIVRHVHNLKSTIFTVVGQVDGKTLLPLPAGSEGIEDIDLENEKSMERIDKSLVYAMESAIIDWSHQIQEALKKESSEPLLQGSNPNPKVELEFWKNRCDDLECIYNQLTTRKVRNMMELLERVESSYIPAFKTMLMDVEAALTEAQDVHLHLTPLKRRLEDVERVEFSEVKPFLLPLLHVVCLIWVTSKHYNMPVRIVVLLQEICNLLIEQALVYLSPEDLLKGDMEESLGKVRMVLGILNMFKEAFEERREKLHMYYEPGQEVREWDFSSTMVFARLDTFLKRLEMVEDLLATSLDLMKLEKIEFSGIKGKTLGQQVLDMYEEFQEAYKVFSERTYDCLDLTNTDFEQDAFGFQQKVEDMDRRLGTIFIQAFDDASNLDHAFKLLDMFGSLLERPVVAADAAGKYSVLISMFSRALDHARLIYSRHIQAELKLGSPPVHKNMPPVAGALRWAQELRARIQVPFDHFRHIPHLCLDSAEGRRVIEKYEEMIQLLDRYQEKLYADWSQTVSEKSQYNLTQPLIRRDPETKLITVTFDPQVRTSFPVCWRARLQAVPHRAWQVWWDRY